MKMIFIFIDGFGIGEDDKSKNPIYKTNPLNIELIMKDYLVIPTDAALGIPGLPQSATGQTTIFTGVNASKVLGRHLSGQPTLTLREIINKNNLFKELIKMGLKVTNSNVYREEYLIKMLDQKDRRYRPSVTSVMSVSAGLKFRTVEDYRIGKGIYHDITGKIIQESGYEVDLSTPQEAAQRLYSISRDYDFTLYEHFMTDIIGHKMNMELAVQEIELLDAFLGELIRQLNFEEDVVIITSDHGNIEDVSVKTHTLNKVPVIIIGAVPKVITSKITSLTDITPAIIEIFKDELQREKVDEQ